MEGTVDQIVQAVRVGLKVIEFLGHPVAKQINSRGDGGIGSRGPLHRLHAKPLIVVAVSVGTVAERIIDVAELCILNAPHRYGVATRLLVNLGKHVVTSGLILAGQQRYEGRSVQRAGAIHSGRF